MNDNTARTLKFKLHNLRDRIALYCTRTRMIIIMQQSPVGDCKSNQIRIITLGSRIKILLFARSITIGLE